jgi:hypothetical protein
VIIKNRIKIKAKKKGFLSDSLISSSSSSSSPSLLLFLSVMMIILSMALVHPLYAQTLENTNLSNDPGRSTDPRISVSGNNVYVVWSDTTTGNGDIYFKASTDNGTTFGGTTNLSNDPGRSTDPRISVSGKNNVYVVWSDTTTGNGDIYFKASTDNGTTFGGRKNLSNNNTGVSSGVKITASGKNNVYVVWSDTTTGNGDIYFRASTNNGVNFTGKKVLSSRSDVGSSISPQIAASGKSNVYVVWSDTTTGNGDIYFRASADNGTKFSTKRNLTLRNSGSSISPQIAASGNNVYVVWSDNTPGNSDTFLKASTNNGANFSGTKFLSSDAGSSYDPKIAVSGKNNVYVVWEDNTIGQNNVSKSFYLYFRASTNAGANFSIKESLNRNIGQLADYSQIAAAGDNAYVVWSDISLYQGVYEVFLRAIIDNGTAISDPIKISNTNGSSISPQIATSGDYIYIVWQDDTTGNGDIYFRRGVG